MSTGLLSLKSMVAVKKAQLQQAKQASATSEASTSSANEPGTSDAKNEYSYAKSSKSLSKPFLHDAKQSVKKRRSKQTPEQRKAEEAAEMERLIEQESLRKSRLKLEQKASLYEKYARGKLREEDKSVVLVDFDRKIEEHGPGILPPGTPAPVVDERLDAANPIVAGTSKEELGSKELVSGDMRREAERQEWEEEFASLPSDAVHYQHVLGDEKWEHGAGYFHFSTDETERKRQMEALKNLRAKTLQDEAQANPPAPPHPNMPTDVGDIPLPPPEDPAVIAEREATKEALAAEDAKRKDYIRPWDERKRPLLTQDEWVDKKRKERKKEFAPPQFYP